AALALRRQDRAALIELLPDEAGALECAVSAWPNVRVETGDGFERLKAFLPPRERRGLTLIDPPYEQTREDYARVGAAIVEALRRFETGIIAVWYPIKDARDAAAWLATLTPRIARETLTSELWLHPCDSRLALNGSGLIIINPPFGFAERARAWPPELHALLDSAGAGGCRLVPVERPK
ncbi:MAG TPA: 23S rRNA (adenine(2030)-N(6))-methyltransferase RlmJ, partial [Steroidobacteraceae bacterium]